MDADREKRIEDLYQQALDLPAHERSRFLANACGTDVDLRHEIESFIQHGEAAPTQFLAGAGSDSGDAEPVSLFDGMVGRNVGRYKLLHVIASGGMGTVYEAEQAQPHRRVAVKLIRQGIASRSAIRRFQYESEALGRLNHPAIAQVFESGIHREPAGVVPFLAMELLSGAVPITRYAADASLSRDQRIGLFLTVCDAVQYAHQRAVIHRDLKPENVLLMPDGRPKVIDFGVARIVETNSVATISRTQTGGMVGTMRYMSPEQYGPAAIDLDARADVYSLGVILFELLTGRRPYDLDGVSPFDAQRQIQSAAPRRPSALSREVSGDLETILLKAVEKDRQDRYQSVAEMAADLRRYLACQPIEARRHTTFYVLRKAARRHAVAAALAVVFLMLGGAATTGLAILYRRAEHQRHLSVKNLKRALDSERAARQAAAEASAVTVFLNDMLSSIDPATARGRDVSVLRELVDDAAHRVRSEFSEQPVVAASLADTIGTVYMRLALFDEAEPLLRDALAWRESALPADHPDVADSLNSLALLLKQQRRYDEAEPLYRRALTINLGTYGERHDVSITAMNNLGALLKAQRKYADAEALYRRALQGARALHGPEHEAVARGLHNLAMLLRARRDYQGAIPLFEEAVAIHRRLYGSDHPRVAISLGYLGQTLADVGRIDEGASSVQAAVQIARRVLPGGHPDTGRLLVSWAEVEKARSRFDAAERLFREGITILAGTMGHDARAVTTAKNNLALVMKARGDFQTAERLYREVLASRRRVHGDRHGSLAAPMYNLARLLQEQEHYAEAEAVATELVALFSTSDAGSAGRLGDALLMLGSIRIGAGRWAEAEDPLRRALALHEKVHGKDGVLPSRIRASLGRCLFHTGRLSEAKRHLAAAFTGLRNATEPENTEVSDVANLLAAICDQQGQRDEATIWRQAGGPPLPPDGTSDHDGPE